MKHIEDGYYRLHGLPPRKIIQEPVRPHSKALIDLGPLERICYYKRIWEDGKEKPSILYCHRFGHDPLEPGEEWPEELHGRLAPVLARNERGEARIIPQRVVDIDGKTVDATFVTDHGYEDIPMSRIKTVPRANPSPAHGSSRRNPTAPVMTQVRVYQVGPVGQMVRHLLAGLAGAVTMPTLEWYLSKYTRVSPVQRAAAVASVGLFSGVAIARRFPRFGAGLSLGGFAAATRPALDAWDLATATQQPMPTAPPAPPRPAPQIPSTTQPSQGVLGSGFGSRLVDRIR